MARRHDALVPLSHDHQKALSLAFRLLHPSPPAPVTPNNPPSTPESRRIEALAFFADHLVEHFAIEEELLFPALLAQRDASLDEAVRSLAEEHAQLRGLRDRLEAASDADETAALLERFGGALERHVRSEERGIFTDFPASLATEEVERLHAAIHARRPPDEPGRAQACKTQRGD